MLIGSTNLSNPTFALLFPERNSLEEEKLLRERDEIRARMEAKGPEGVTQDDLMEERRAANRLSAFQSRQRRNTLIKDLQTKVAELTRDNEESEEVIRQLRIELDQSRSENQELRKQLNDERSRESNTMAPTEAAAAQGSSFPNPVAPPLRSSPSDVAFHGHKNRSAGRSDPNPENFIPFLQAMLSAVSSPLNQAPPPGSTKQQLQFQVNASASTTATPHMNQGSHQSHGLPNSGAMPPDPSYSASNNFTGPPQQPPPVAAGQPPRDNQNLLESLLNMLQKK